MERIESPRTDDNAIEAEIKAKGKTAPRITPDVIQRTIKSVHYFTAGDGVYSAELHAHGQPVTNNESLNHLTFCVLILQNGFTVTGESACASPENYDYGIGCKIARQNAEQKIWALEGYVLKCNLAAHNAL